MDARNQRPSSSASQLLNEVCQDRNQHFINYNDSHQQREKSLILGYAVLIRKQLETIAKQDLEDKSKPRFWNPKTMLNNLSLMEEKVHQLQELVQLIVRTTKSSVDQTNTLTFQQQQLVTADLTSIIIQLISTAGSLLPLVKHPHLSPNPSVDNPSKNEQNNNSNCIDINNNADDEINDSIYKIMVNKVEDQPNETDHMDVHEEHESRDDGDVDEGENLPPGSYEILQPEKEEILAPHTHFCVICFKGFKRDANLRMHMRGHGDEYKTAAALAKPRKDTGSEPKLIKRYSCPYFGCKRNKDHIKFQPLKTILCVKNHYKRTHCDKSYTCSRCNTKKFSVVADLKTHEKHCGRDRWLCSCGTTFSRKDKLFGHIALFQGHTPAIPSDESKGGASHVYGDTNIESAKQVDFGFSSNGLGGACFSPLNMNGFQEFPPSMFEESDSLSYLLPGSLWKNGAESSSKDLQ